MDRWPTPQRHTHGAQTGVQRVRTKRDERSGSGAMGVPIDELAGEAHVGDTPEENMEQESVSNDVEMDFAGHVGASQGIGSLEPSFDDEVAEMLLAELGSSGRDRITDGHKAVKKLVSEIYFPPRITDLLKPTRSRHLMAGFALDLTVAITDGRLWDVDDVVMRDRARKRLLDERPMLLVGSPMCTAFSTWQRINNKIRDPVTVAGELRTAKQHLEFCVELYRIQVQGGRYFVHEHPAYASSWQTEIMESIMKDDGVTKATCDQCQYGGADESGNPVKKPTSFMTNAPELAR